MPVEIVEAVTPVIFDRKELRPGSGGAGATRGGDGQIIQFRMHTKDEWLLNAVASRVDEGPEGLGGGGAGRRRQISHQRQAGARPQEAHLAAGRRRIVRDAGRRRVRTRAEPKTRDSKREEGHDNEITRGRWPRLAATLSAAPAGAQQVYKIGISAGLTGYAATVDRGWRDGVEVAAAGVNAKGGIMGRKIEVVTEDNKSEPQEAVTVYRKMIRPTKSRSSCRAASRPEISPPRRSWCARKSRWCCARSCRRTPTT